MKKISFIRQRAHIHYLSIWKNIAHKTKCPHSYTLHLNQVSKVEQVSTFINWALEQSIIYRTFMPTFINSAFEQRIVVRKRAHIHKPSIYKSVVDGKSAYIHKLNIWTKYRRRDKCPNSLTWHLRRVSKIGQVSTFIYWAFEQSIDRRKGKWPQSK